MRNKEYQYINFIRERLIPDAHKKHFGSYMSFNDQNLSPGCMSCKTGGWLCLFIGNRCNCTCLHCPNPNVTNYSIDISTGIGMNEEININQILRILEKPVFTGVGISGGEPLLYIDKLVEWIQKIKLRHPHIYIWFYTNGILANEPIIKKLAATGVDEVRFDLAATNYSQGVLKNMHIATKYIKKVAIEIPVILEQYHSLVDTIKFADSINVQYINLHDLYINPSLYKNGLGGYIPTTDPLSCIQRDIYSSSILIYKIFRFIRDNDLKIIPNDCTLINMQLQTLGLKYQKISQYVKDMNFNKYIETIIRNTDEEKLLIEILKDM